jgi:hypothetical protein
VASNFGPKRAAFLKGRERRISAASTPRTILDASKLSIFTVPGTIFSGFLPDSPMFRVKVWNITVKKVVSNFYDLHVGEIAFLVTFQL